MIVDADWGIGGKVESSMLPLNGILERDKLGKGRVTSDATEVSAIEDGSSVGDVGNGGTPPTEEDVGVRCELKDDRERENDDRREASDDFLLNDILGLFFSLSLLSLSLV